MVLPRARGSREAHRRTSSPSVPGEAEDARPAQSSAGYVWERPGRLALFPGRGSR
jgi:hypothetical protein